jgi:diacylglycerol O-acyltransferase / wax synthase
MRQLESAAGVAATTGELATLWVDDPAAPFHVALLCRFAAGPFMRPDGSVDTERVRAEVARRITGVPALGRRLTGGRRPVWIREAVRPGDHLQCVELPDGTDLLDWCSGRILAPLAPGRPLWRVDVIGLPDGGFALLFVAHHVLVDGRRGAAVLRSLLDPPSRAAAGHPAPAGRPAAGLPVAPNRWELLRHALADLRARAPVTSLSRPVGHGRRIVEVRAGLAGLRTLEAVYGATVNDALLAAVTAGLRELLLRRGDAVDGLTLRASVPLSSGSAGQPEGMLLVPLPVSEADPLRRLAMIRETTTALKRRIRSGGGNVFDVLRLPIPLARAAVHLMRHVAGRRINLFVSDIPGPAEPLDLCGARLLSALPVAPLTANVPLGIAALSYGGTLFIGVNADAAVTDAQVLGDAMEREFGILATAAASGAPLLAPSQV